jgi:hypothetical protein
MLAAFFPLPYNYPSDAFSVVALSLRHLPLIWIAEASLARLKTLVLKRCL